MIEAFPLQWPLGKSRTRVRSHSRFDTPLGKAIRAVNDEVQRLGGREMVISSNLSLRRDGLPYAQQNEPQDAGVAVYFKYKGKPMCFACDRWWAVRDNMWAIAKTIEALRGIERWGTGEMVQQAFTGFMALPAPEQPWQTLGLPDSHPTKAQIDEAHRRLASQHHPDKGGDADQMARINTARDDLYRQLQT